MQRGWVRLYRRIQEHDLWRIKPFTPGQAWVDMILTANYDTCTLSYPQRYWAKRWGWSRSKVAKFMIKLEKDGMIEILESGQVGERTKGANNEANKVYICNYYHFQQVANNEANKGREHITIRKTNNTLKEQIYIVGNYWNSKKIIHHGPKSLLKIETPLKKHLLAPYGKGDYWTDDICQAICNYAIVLHGKEYYWTHKWNLWDFLQRGFDKFINEADPLNNFRKIEKDESWMDRALKRN